MVLFWHDHFAVSVSKVAVPSVMTEHFEALRSHALGSFGELLNAAARDQAMLFWLDQQENRKGRPNENWARELFELFTLGIGNYTESDIRECARAFTGWTFGRKRGQGAAPFPTPRPGASHILHEPDHDTGAKTVLGRSLRTGQEVLDLAASHPATAEHLAGKFWRWFASPADPPPGVLARLAARFRASGMQIRELLRGLMTDPAFYEAAEQGQLIKHPYRIVRQMAEATAMDAAQRRRLIGSGPRSGNGAVSAPGALFLAARAMGMELMRPPDVAGWPGGDAWISTSLMVERIRLADQWRVGPPGSLLAKDAPALACWPRDRKELAEWLVRQSGLAVTPVRLEAAERALGEGDPIPAAQLAARAGRALTVLFADPEFQVC
jgi:uncharacterized protein (DUF1800 family)